MTWPAPVPGLVLRYAYLWQREAAAGRQEGTKTRPCAVVVALHDRGGRLRLAVAPVTHSAPTRPDDALEIPGEVKRHLGLDEERSWVVLTEVNEFAWPGPDLRPNPGAGSGSVAFGVLPPRFFRALREQLDVLRMAGRLSVIRRTE